MSAKMKSGPSKEQMENKKGGRGKGRKSPELPAPKYTKINPSAPPPNQDCSWKKSKLKTLEIEALISAGFWKEKALSGCNTATGDAWPMEKNPLCSPTFASED